MNAGTFVEVDLATTEREDHRPVFTEIVLAPAPFVSPKRQGLKYSRDKLQDPSCCAAFSDAVSQLKTPDFSVDVDTHYQWVSNFAHGRHCFSPPSLLSP